MVQVVFSRILYFLATWTAAFCLLGSAWARADDDLRKYFEGMRQRRLHELAESFGRDLLTQPNLPDEERVQITIELARTFADHATQSNPSEEAARWDKARDVLREITDRELSLPLRLSVELQAAMVDFAHGEANRWRHDLLPDDSALSDTARASLARAIGRFKAIREQVQTPGPRGTRNQRRRTESLSVSQRRSLLRRVDLQQARGLMNLAQTYPAGSPDRLDALNRAVALLRPLAEPSEHDFVVAWPSIIDLAECQRLMGDLDRAKGALDSIWDLEPPDEVLDRALALNARLLLEEGNVEPALALLEDHRRALTTPSDELEFLYIEALLAKWRRLGAEENAETEELRERVMNLIRQFHTRNSGYWVRRAELLLARDVREGTVAGGMPLLVSAAEILYRSNRFAEAAEVYGKASRQAGILGHTAKAFDLGFTRGAVLTGAERYADASDVFRTLALQHPSHARAAEAHLMSAFTRGRVLAAQPTPGNQQAYRQVLEEHLGRFAASDTSGEANWLLGRLEESQGRYSEAVAHYGRIALDHARVHASHEAVGRCYDAWMREARQAEQSTDAILTKATRFFQQVFRESRQDRTDTALRIHSAAGVHLARLWLSAIPPRYREAERVLERLLAGSYAAAANTSAQDPRTMLLREARQLLVVALAGQGQLSEAERQMQRMAGGNPEETVQLLMALDEVGMTAEARVQRALGELQLKLLVSLRTRRNRFGQRDRYRFDLAEARALARVGKTDEARKAFDRLNAQGPNDLELLQAQGELLMSLDRKETYTAAAEIWRKLESMSSAESTLWYRARYNLALSYYELGDRTRCRKLIGVTRLLHPDLGGPDLRRRYDELWRRTQPEG